MDNVFDNLIIEYEENKKHSEDNPYSEILDIIERGYIPESFYVCSNSIYNFMFRDKIIDTIGYTNVAYNWIRPLARYIGNKKCVEIMAGSGAFTRALNDCGINCIATDNYSWTFRSKYCNVEDIDCLKALDIEADYYICGWPPYNNNIAYKFLIEMRKKRPNAKLIYVGEAMGGCCADDMFFEELIMCDDLDFNMISREYVQHFGIYDYLLLVK